MKRILFCILLIGSLQSAYSMDIESFENFANADKKSLEYGAARLWIDGFIGGIITMKSAFKGSSEAATKFPGLNGEQVCFPKNREMAEVLMEAGRKEVSENRTLYYGSKLGGKFPMNVVLWTGMSRFFPCPNLSTN